MDNRDIIFPIKNSKSLQKEDFMEWMYKVMEARIKVPFIIVVSLSTLFYAIVFVSLLLDMRIVSAFYIALVSVCLSIALCFRFLVPKALGELRYSQACLMGQENSRVVLFYQDHLELRAGEETLTRLSYETIKKTDTSEHLFIIVFPKLVNCIVRRDGFSEADFRIVQAQIHSSLIDKEVTK